LADERRPADKKFGTLEDARIDVRVAGYCVMCDRIVERADDGSCPEGHPAEAVTGRVVLGPQQPVPRLSGFNLAAFLIPPIWGPAHGQWVGVVFLPIWLFVDSIVASGGAGGISTRSASLVVVVATLAFQAFFAKRANGLAWRRVADTVPVAHYARRERWWAIASVPIAAALLGWAVWFHLVFAVASR
jgi:hypothetical protein